MNNQYLIGVTDLTPAEIIALWSMRTRVRHGPDSPLLVKGFCSAFGLSNVESALAYFESAFRILANHVKYDLWLLSPGCDFLSRGEAFLLHFLASVQSDRTALSKELAGTLVTSDWVYPFYNRLQGWVSVFRERHLYLPLRSGLSPRNGIEVGRDLGKGTLKLANAYQLEKQEVFSLSYC